MENRVRLVSLSLLLAGLLLAPALSFAKTDKAADGKRKLARGDYADGIASLEKAGASVDVLNALGRAYLDVGRYDDAEKLGEKLSKVRKGFADGQVIVAAAEQATGRYAAAEKRLAKVVKKHPKYLEARVKLSELRVLTGAKYDQLKESDAIADFFSEDEFTDAPRLVWLARALHLGRYYRNANEIFMEASEADPKYVLTELYWAQLFLEKEDEQNAGKSVGKVLAINPHHPLALTLEAFMDTSSANDSVKALKHLDQALATNPRFVPALQTRAHVFIELEQFQEAQTVLESALKIDARHPKTLAMLATCRLLLEDPKGFKSWMGKAAATNKRYAEGWYLVAEYATRQHRYKEAMGYYKKAIGLDDEYWPAYVGLGLGHSRTGNDKKANELLQTAFENDSFNVRAFNMTQHFYDGPAKRMEWHQVGAFKVRMEKSEATVLKKLLPAFLKEAFDTHKKHYGFTPTSPLNLELFKDRNTFNVRSVAYPGMGAHGYCFGHVVTAVSPSNGDFNWAMVMWHELAHVWHIQMSKSRVPRWFTEGLAEFETKLARPEWSRQMDAQLWEFHKAGKLKGIKDFNTMFTGAQSLHDIVVAYYYATKVVEFIHKEYGFDVFPKMLNGWGKLKGTEQVFDEVLRSDLAAFDARVKTWLETEALAAFTHEFDPGDKDKATTEPQKAYHAGVDALKRSAWKEALDQFEEVLTAGKDGAELRGLLADAAVGLEDWAGAKKHLEASLKLNGQRMMSFKVLMQVLEKQKDEDGLYEVKKRAALFDGQGASLSLEICAGALERGNKKDLVEFAERGMNVAPFDPRVRACRAEAMLTQGRADAALKEVDFALDLEGAGKAPELKVAEARAWIHKGKKGKARKILEALGTHEPAKKLLQSL